jgi:hypothetical protein
LVFLVSVLDWFLMVIGVRAPHIRRHESRLAGRDEQLARRSDEFRCAVRSLQWL